MKHIKDDAIAFLSKIATQDFYEHDIDRMSKSEIAALIEGENNGRIQIARFILASLMEDYVGENIKIHVNEEPVDNYLDMMAEIEELENNGFE